MKKILIGISATVLLLVAAPMAAPRLVDWNGYRDEIAARIGEVTGRTLSIGGDVGLRLLPTPAFTVEDVRIAAPAGFTRPEMAVLKRLDAQVALLPLLSGRIQVENIVAVSPQVVVEMDARGRVNWAGGDPAAPNGAAARRLTPPLAQALSFDQITIENGRLDVIDRRSGLSVYWDDVDLRVVAGSLTGPFQINGGVRLRGAPLRLEAATGRFADGAAAPLRLALTLPGGDPERLSGARFAGIIGGAGNGPRLQGDLRLEGPDFRGAVQPLRQADAGEALPMQLARPFSLRATLEAGDDRLRFDNLEASLGDTRAAGNVTVTQGEIADIAATLLFNRLDLDVWAPLFAAADGKGKRAGVTARPSPPAASPAGGFRLPEQLRARLDVSVDAANYAGGTVRHGRLMANLADGAITIDRLSALAPGRTTLAGSGRITAVNGSPRGELQVEAGAEQLRGLLEWLRLDPGTVPADRLQNAELVGRIVASPDRLDVADVDLTVDASRWRGALAVEWRDRPAFGLRLEVDDLDLDRYRPPAAATVAAPSVRRPPAAVVDPGKALDEGEAWMGRWLALADFTVDAAAGRLVVGGHSLTGLRLDATMAGGGLDLREISVADVGGVTARVAGQAASLAPLSGAHLTVQADSKDLNVAAWLPDWLGVTMPPGLGAGGIEARLAGDRSRLALETTITAAGATLALGGEATRPLALLGGGGRFDVAARLSHDDADTLLGLIGWRAPAAAGPFDVYAQLAGDTARLALQDIRGTLGATPLAGSLKLDRRPVRPALEGDLQIGVIDIDRLMDAGGAAAPISPAPAVAAPAGEPGPAAASDLMDLRRLDGHLALTVGNIRFGGLNFNDGAARLRLNDGALSVDRFDAGLLGGRVGGRADLSAADRADGRGADRVNGRPPRFAFAMTAEGVKPAGGVSVGPLTINGGVVDAEVDLHIGDPLAVDWRRRLNGSMRVSARGGELAGFDMAALRDRLQRVDRPQAVVDGVLRGLSGGRTPFTTLDASCQMADGVAETTDARLEAPAGGAGAVGRLDFANRSIDMLVTVEPNVDPPFPPLALRLRGGLDAPVRTLDIGALQRHLQERLGGGTDGGGRN